MVDIFRVCTYQYATWKTLPSNDWHVPYSYLLHVCIVRYSWFGSSSRIRGTGRKYPCYIDGGLLDDNFGLLLSTTQGYATITREKFLRLKKQHVVQNREKRRQPRILQNYNKRTRTQTHRQTQVIIEGTLVSSYLFPGTCWWMTKLSALISPFRLPEWWIYLTSYRRQLTIPESDLLYHVKCCNQRTKGQVKLLVCNLWENNLRKWEETFDIYLRDEYFVIIVLETKAPLKQTKF